MDSNDHDDWVLSIEQALRIEALTREEIREIDALLLACSADQWRKLARVVGTAMTQSNERYKGLPDIYYAERVAELVNAGALEASGDLLRMGFCEIRLREAATRDA